MIHISLIDTCMLTLAISALKTNKTYSPSSWRMTSCYAESFETNLIDQLCIQNGRHVQTVSAKYCDFPLSMHILHGFVEYHISTNIQKQHL